MTDQPTGLFWEVSAATLAHSDVAVGTMMGFPVPARLGRVLRLLRPPLRRPHR